MTKRSCADIDEISLLPTKLPDITPFPVSQAARGVLIGGGVKLADPSYPPAVSLAISATSASRAMTLGGFQCRSVPLSNSATVGGDASGANHCQRTIGNCAKISAGNQRAGGLEPNSAASARARSR